MFIADEARYGLLGSTYPSHPSSLRRVTCIKDGFFCVVSRHDDVDKIVHRVVGRDDLNQVIKSLLHDAEERGVNV